MNEYWVVSEKNTGRIIAHCGDERDAIMMLLLKSNRTYRKQKFLMDQVINVTSSGIKELPGQQGLPEAKISLQTVKEELNLPEGHQIPVSFNN